MPSYDALHYDPPAAVAVVTIRSPEGAIVNDVHLLLDTGADATLLPRIAVLNLGITPDPAMTYELIGFDGTQSRAQAVDLDMIFLQQAFRGRYLLIDGEHGVLGRDVLAKVALLFDGPVAAWSEQTSSR